MSVDAAEPDDMPGDEWFPTFEGGTELPPEDLNGTHQAATFSDEPTNPDEWGPYESA